MANLKAIRTRIVSVRSTRQITSAMKMVSAAKLRKAQDKIVRLRPYAGKLHEILVDLTKSLAGSQLSGIYGKRPVSEKILIVLVTSNRGLCGAFNSNIIREARRIILEKYPEHFRNGNLHFTAIGKKGFDFLRKSKLKVAGEYNNLLNELNFENAAVAAGDIMKSYLAHEYDHVEIVYNHFKNAAVQILTCETFLPVEADSADEHAENMSSDYIYEPGKEEIVKELIPKSLKIQFYKAVLDSYVAEHGARMTAMHKATDNATTMIRELTLQ